MPSLSPDDPVGSPPDLAWLRRGWWVVVVCVVLGAIGGLLLAMITTKSYEATTSVLVLPTVGGDGTTIVRSGDVNMDNEIQIVRSQPVGDEARGLLRTSTSTDELIKQVTVEVPANTYILKITAEADTAEGALTVSHSFAEAYLSVRGTAVKEEVNDQIKALEDQFTALNKELTGLAGDLALPSDDKRRAAAESQRLILVPQISQTNARLGPLRAAAVEPGSIINDARLPEGPSAPVPALFVASGAVLGLFAGLCIAYVVGGRRRRVRSASDMNDRSGRSAQVVAFELPGPVAEVVLLPTGGGGEVFDRLRLALSTAGPADRPAVLVCPVTASAGASLVTVNLASSLARSGHRVLILCADPRSKTPEVLGVRSDSGLADCLRDSLELSERVQISTLSARVAVVAPGRDLPGALSATSAERLAVLLLTLRQDTSLVRSGDFVLVEAPDTTRGVDAQELARVVDCCVIVAETGRATVRDVDRTVADLASVGGTVAAHFVVPALPIHGSNSPVGDGLPTAVPAGAVPSDLPTTNGSGRPADRARS